MNFTSSYPDAENADDGGLGNRENTIPEMLGKSKYSDFVINKVVYSYVHKITLSKDEQFCWSFRMAWGQASSRRFVGGHLVSRIGSWSMLQHITGEGLILKAI